MKSSTKILRIFKIPLGLKGFFDYEEALEYSKKVNKPLFLDFTGFACEENCRLMEHNVWAKPHILEMLKKDYIIVSLFVDSKYELDQEDWLTDKGKTIKQLGLKTFTCKQKSLIMQLSLYMWLLITKKILFLNLLDIVVNKIFMNS